MQAPVPRTNPERAAATQGQLIAAARRLFVEKGYADTGTPEIVAAAGVTRGALYHHYADKADLLRAVARQAAREVAEAVAAGSAGARTPVQALTDGASAYFAAMAQGGRARLLLLEAPVALPPDALLELSALAGANELRAGLAEALARQGRAAPRGEVLDALAEQLSAAFDRAALAIARGAPAEPQLQAMRWLLRQLTTSHA